MPFKPAMDPQSDELNFTFQASATLWQDYRFTWAWQLPGNHSSKWLAEDWRSLWGAIRVRTSLCIQGSFISSALKRQLHQQLQKNQHAHKECWRFFSLSNYTKEGIQSYLKNRTPIKDRGTHENHSVSWDGGRRSIVDVMRFKNNLAVGSHGNPVAIGQSQGFIIIQNGIQIFNPDGVNWTIENYPDMVPWNATQEETKRAHGTEVPV